MEIKWLPSMPVHHLLSAKDVKDCEHAKLEVFTEDEQEGVTSMDRSHPLEELLVLRTEDGNQQRMSKWRRVGGEYFNDVSA